MVQSAIFIELPVVEEGVMIIKGLKMILLLNNKTKYF
jgi:hypothetical protein